jgi:Fic family protein
MLIEAAVLQQPLLYMSLFFKQHRSCYYELLDRLPPQGDWEAWLAFFLEGLGRSGPSVRLGYGPCASGRSPAPSSSWS